MKGGSRSTYYKAKNKGKEAGEDQQEDVSNQRRIIDELDKDEGDVLMNEKEETEEVRDNTDDAQVKGRQTDIYQIDMDHAAKVLISVAAVVPTVTVAPVKVVIPSTKQKRGVVIWDPEDKSSAKTLTETKSKDKGKAQKAAKRRRLNEEAKDVEELKRHLEIMHDEDDNVYTEATLLAMKVPIVDYQIILLNNKPRYKIIRADGTHQLTTQIILLVERRYPLSKFTLEQMLNVVRLQVEEQTVSFGVDAAMELKEKHQMFTTTGKDISAARQKWCCWILLLDSAAEMFNAAKSSKDLRGINVDETKVNAIRDWSSLKIFLEVRNNKVVDAFQEEYELQCGKPLDEEAKQVTYVV
uniref:Uncharacterized protein n=1 Tax=Tanacetum cinerariifolium TaxID=118510 RepID=A0A6L2NHF5_TANCI|nr:hypothetical protein [Tanacetum cinerariifolium]